MTCARCGRETGDARPVNALVKLAGSFALAFMHAGMWVFEELGKPYCPACRRKATAAVLVAASAILGVAAGGVYLWTRGPAR
jgi:hypothetical protein